MHNEKKIRKENIKHVVDTPKEEAISKENIVSKGKYAKPQSDQLVGVKQYIFVRGEKGKKQLLLRFCNNRSETCQKFSFILYRMDVKGNILGEEKYESTGQEYYGKSDFSFERAIPVEEKCTDFLVQMVSAEYGIYTYHVENGEVSVTYDERRPVSQATSRNGSRAKPRKINRRTFDMPKRFVFVALLLLFTCFVAMGFLVKGFTDREKSFALSGVHYTFTSSKKTDVKITGCSENYKKIDLFDDIEGHKVVGIETGAFRGNRTLTDVTITGVNLDNGAFSGCSSLETVRISNIKSIGDGAFSGCGNLNSVEVMNENSKANLTLGKDAFSNCQRLTDVIIDQTIIYPEGGAIFTSSTNIERLKLKNFAYNIKGVTDPLKYQTELASLFGDTKNANSSSNLIELTIDNIDMFGDGFAKGFTKLEKVTVTKSKPKYIGKEAFADCKSLNTLSVGAPAEHIGSYAFKNTALTAVDLSGLKYLGNYAFLNAKSLASVKGLDKAGIVSLPEGVFEGCLALETFIVPQKIVVLGDGCFKNSGLKTFELPKTVTYVGKNLLSGCKRLESLTIASLTQGYVGYFFGGVKDNLRPEDYSAAFAKVIPDTLKTIKLQSGTEISSHAFAGCSFVTKIDLPDGVTSFGDYAFDGCTSLSTLVFPMTLTSVGTYACASTAIETAELPTSLERLGWGAFFDCKKLKKIKVPFLGQTPYSNDQTLGHAFASSDLEIENTLPASLEIVELMPKDAMVKIPDNAFAGCKSVKTFVLPNGIKEIGKRAFAGCLSLTTYDFTGVETVGDAAFRGCSSLVSAPFDSSIKTIGEGAFESTSLKDLTLHDDIERIGFGIIKDCKEINSIKVPFLGATAAESETSTIAHLLGISNNQLTAKQVPEKLTSITLTYPIRSLPAYAFYNCQGLTTINIPDSVVSIGEYSFYNTGIADTRLNEQMLEINDYAYAECKNLATVNLPETIDYIGQRAFYNTAITSVKIPEGVTDIYSYAFASCDELSSVTFPSGLNSIDSYAFAGDKKISSLALPEGLTYIGECALQGLSIARLEIPNTVTYIGWGALKDCDKIVSLSFPLSTSCTSLTTLLGKSNLECLKSVTVDGGNYGSIDGGAFRNERYIEEVIITGDVYSINSEAFYGCEELRYVSIPSSVSSISDYAFDGCIRLYEITNNSSYVYIYEGEAGAGRYAYSVSVGERAPYVDINGYRYARYDGEWYLIDYEKNTSVSPNATFNYDGETISRWHVPSNLFSGCYGVETVKFPSSVQSIGEAVFNSSEIRKVMFDVNAPIQTIPAYSFSYCSYLTSVELPSSVKRIEQNAFEYCASLSSVIFPISLEYIGDQSFVQCYSLNNVKLYSNVAYIGSEAFYGCEDLYDVYNEGKVSLVAGSRDNGYAARYAVKVHTDMNEASSVEISINNIGTFRRSGGSWLLIKGASTKNVNLSTFKYGDTTVKSYRVAENAFANNNTIETLIVSDAVEQIQLNAFSNCSNLKSIDLASNKSIREIEENTFSYCSRLRFAYLPDTVEKIGESAFYSCTMLEEIDMPTSLETIAGYAFYDCGRLISVTLYGNVISIGDGAFYSCDHLLEVINLSNLSLTVGSSLHGNVAQYAFKVANSEDNGLERYEKDGMKFIKAGNTWYLYSSTEKNKTMLVVPELSGELVILDMSIINLKASSIIMPKNLTSLHIGVFQGCSNMSIIYFADSESAWENVDNSYEYDWNYSVYYYDKCVHSYSAWTYDSNGNVTTAFCQMGNKTTTVSPTCYESGLYTYYCLCDGCSYKEYEDIPMLEHEFAENKCKHCGATRIVVDDTNLEALVENGVISLDGFEYNKDKKYFVSTNKESSSVGTLVIKINSRADLFLRYSVSSEWYGDYMRIYVEQSDGYKYLQDEISGTSGGNSSITLELDEGDLVYFEYAKDSSYNDGDDCGYIKDIQLIER